VIFVVAESLDFFKQAAIATGGDYPIRQLVLYEKNFDWMALWELNPEMLGSLWLMASAAWGEVTLAEGLHDCRRRAVPL
jgi:hypothetical protein